MPDVAEPEAYGRRRHRVRADAVQQQGAVELSGDDVIDARPIMGKTTHLSPTPDGDLVVGTGEMLD